MASQGPDDEPSTPLVSYAQNGEDIVLARGLTGERGFYVDIGAYDPEIESVTRLFYERGWQGINVDPITQFIDRFEVERPRDINICAAIGLTDGTQQIWVSPQRIPGHSTADAGVAGAHAADGYAFEPRVVASMTLDTLFERYVPAGRKIDFLKIDVEGAEGAVLASWTSRGIRPRVIVVESMAPYVAGSTHGAWEHFLVDSGYRLSTFDGLNRYYVEDHEHELLERLSAPASILDNFETAGSRALRTYASALEDELATTKQWAASLGDRVRWLESRLATGGSD